MQALYRENIIYFFEISNNYAAFKRKSNLILKIDSTKKISLNIRNLNYSAGNSHRYSHLSIDGQCL